MIGSWLPKFVKQIVGPSRERNIKSAPVCVIYHAKKCPPKENSRYLWPRNCDSPRSYHHRCCRHPPLIWHNRHYMPLWPSIYGLKYSIDANCIFTDTCSLNVADRCGTTLSWTNGIPPIKFDPGQVKIIIGGKFSGHFWATKWKF